MLLTQPPLACSGGTLGSRLGTSHMTMAAPPDNELPVHPKLQAPSAPLQGHYSAQNDLPPSVWPPPSELSPNRNSPAVRFQIPAYWADTGLGLPRGIFLLLLSLPESMRSRTGMLERPAAVLTGHGNFSK